ncbi:MAG: leucine-rich repeat domain-containing protein [Pseudomonadales bacterium]
MNTDNIRASNHTGLLKVGALLLTVAACANYDVTLNERVIYSPPPLFNDFELDDPALTACVRQTIIDQSIAKPGMLRQLRCTHAGIKSLAGIEIFSKLEQINFSNNALISADVLTALSELHSLSLADNRINTIAGLAGNSRLKFLDLSGNNALVCDSIEALLRVHPTLEVSRPLHCQSKATD